MTFRLTLHPGMDGDCVQLSWGRGPELEHLFVDLGRAATWNAVRPVLVGLGEVELFVMSHVDADHVAGAIPMVREDVAAFRPRKVWHNSRPQLAAAEARGPIVEPFSARQGEKLARGIVKFGWPWNGEFESEIVSTDSPEVAQPIVLAGGLEVRLLSPGDAELAALLPRWDDELARAGIRTFDPNEEVEPLSEVFEPLGLPDVRQLAADTYVADDAEANGASIAFIAEFAGRRVLLAADAHSEVMERTLRPLAEAEGGRYRIDILKVCHHGSKANTSPKFLRMIDCDAFAFSTNGTRHHHPDPETISRILMADPDREKTLYFNYRQPSADVWDSRLLQNRWRYRTIFPPAIGSRPSALSIDIGDP